MTPENTSTTPGAEIESLRARLQQAEQGQVPARDAAALDRKLLLSVLEDEQRANQERDAAQARLEEILSGIDQVIWSVDLKAGKMLYMNRATEAVYGRPVQAFFDDPQLWMKVVHPEDLEIAREAERKARAEGSAEAELRIVRPDGEVRWTQISATLVRDADGGPLRLDGLVSDITERKESEEQTQRYNEQLRLAFMRTVEVAMNLSEMRDPYTAGHERRVAEIAVAIGAEMGFDAPRQEGLRVAGYLHDVGKISIPAELLSKPGKLSPVEFSLIKGHAEQGFEVLKNVEFPWPVAQVALQHHERVDGSGYPRGLKGEEILLEARIMAVADVMEAMSSHRPYRAGLGIPAALAEIERGRGTAYDADAADACLRLFRDRHFTIPA